MIAQLAEKDRNDFHARQSAEISQVAARAQAGLDRCLLASRVGDAHRVFLDSSKSIFEKYAKLFNDELASGDVSKIDALRANFDNEFDEIAKQFEEATAHIDFDVLKIAQENCEANVDRTSQQNNAWEAVSNACSQCYSKVTGAGSTSSEHELLSKFREHKTLFAFVIGSPSQAVNADVESTLRPIIDCDCRLKWERRQYIANKNTDDTTLRTDVVNTKNSKAGEEEGPHKCEACKLKRHKHDGPVQVQPEVQGGDAIDGGPPQATQQQHTSAVASDKLAVSATGQQVPPNQQRRIGTATPHEPTVTPAATNEDAGSTSTLRVPTGQ